MRLGFGFIYPLGLRGQNSQTTVDLDEVLDFPAKYSPLNSTTNIQEGDPHTSTKLGYGYSHAQSTDLEGSEEELVSMQFIVNERRDYDELFNFLRTVGKVRPFKMAIPGCTNPAWRVTSWKRSHVANRHWKFDVTVESKKIP